ncbi:hypothetical protein PTTG_12049 [Puccinia triticina 1-1 BBBD Race 1]|uniref:Uncharacterized protein n=1 Tax=Puccinia triticina (isolate 1-1 / race 1 (BBBD)) TaxID=630390 RepID=A0A180GW32_PUCT1|nr:hypothetical protein PTTG_12049 [Puccinia triticina 1-1 BBBD Race 1]
MYNQNMTTKKAVKMFYQKRNTMEIAALSMIKNYDFEFSIDGDWQIRFPCNKGVLRYWKSSPYRTVLKVLDGRDQRYFKYLCLKYFLTMKHFLLDCPTKSMFKDDMLFEVLEESNKIKSSSPDDLKKMKYNVDRYLQIRAYVYKLLNIFQDNLKTGVHNQEQRRRAHGVLEFIEENYDEDILDLPMTVILKEQLLSMTDHFVLLEHLNNILHYLSHTMPEVTKWCPAHQTYIFNLENKDNEDWEALLLKAWEDHDRSKVEKTCEELQMVHEYYQLILSKNKDLLSNLSSKNQWKMIKSVEIIQHKIDHMISDMEYKINQFLSHSYPTLKTSRFTTFKFRQTVL